MATRKQINFNEEMEFDLEQIRLHFKKTFKVTPSNTAIFNLLLQTYKQSNMDITRKPKSRKRFLIEI